MTADVEAARFMSAKVLKQKYSIRELEELKKSIEGKKEFRRLNARIENALRAFINELSS